MQNLEIAVQNKSPEAFLLRGFCFIFALVISSKTRKGAAYSPSLPEGGGSIAGVSTGWVVGVRG
jgi:hypothetical protein